MLILAEMRLGKTPAAVEWITDALSSGFVPLDASSVSEWEGGTLGPLDQWLTLPRSWAVCLPQRLQRHSRRWPCFILLDTPFM